MAGLRFSDSLRSLLMVSLMELDVEVLLSMLCTLVLKAVLTSAAVGVGPQPSSHGRLLQQVMPVHCLHKSGDGEHRRSVTTAGMAPRKVSRLCPKLLSSGLCEPAVNSERGVWHGHYVIHHHLDDYVTSTKADSLWTSTREYGTPSVLTSGSFLG